MSRILRRQVCRLFLSALLISSSVTCFTARSNKNKLETTPRRGGASAKRRITPLSVSSSTAVAQQQQELDLPPRQQRRVNPSRLVSSAELISSTSTTTADEERHQEPLLSKTALICIFGFWNGVADVICHKRHGCYANLMTGNLIQICSSLAEGQWKHAFQIATLIASFMTGVALRQTCSSSRSCAKNNIVPWMAVPILCGSELVYRLSSGQGYSGILGGKHVAVMMLAMAGGIINSFASKATDNTVVFAVTGHVTRIANSIGSSSSIPKASLCVIACFGLGITLTSAVYSHILVGLPLFAILSIPYGLTLMGMAMKRNQRQELMSAVVQMTSTTRKRQ